jgi:lipoate-protein ligase A
MSQKWRIIGLEEHDAYKNMAIDESILENVRDGKSGPTLRFYRWSPSAVSIGRFQSMNDEVNVQRCKELGIDYVRRITGGGAVYHDYGGELTYSVIADQHNFPSGIRESYSAICGWVIQGLKAIGVDADFAPINDVVAGNKKISGNAQTRKQGVLLQHGTILYKLDVHRMFFVLNVSKEKISDKMIKSVEDRVTCVSALVDITFDRFYETMLKAMTEGKECSYGTLSEGEQSRAHELQKAYSSPEWNFSR